MRMVYGTGAGNTVPCTRLLPVGHRGREGLAVGTPGPFPVTVAVQPAS